MLLLFVANQKFSTWFSSEFEGPSPLEEESLDGI
jgi:hypothetical protein